jgi:general secretion pathway protein K
MMQRGPWTRDTGAALLTTLMIVAALSAISVSVLTDMRRDQRLAANAASVAQAQWYAVGADAFARITADDLISGALPRTALAGPPRIGVFPLDAGMMRISVRDASVCINVNGVVSGAGEIYERNETGAKQLAAIMEQQGIPASRANELVGEIVGWIDTGGGSLGADDAPYSRLDPAYLTGAEPLAEISELRAIRGFSPDVIAKLRPWICALPQVGPSRINLNAMTPEQAGILVAATLGKVTQVQAVNLLRRRPPQGWQSIGEVFADPALGALDLPQDALAAFTLDTRVIAIDALVTHRDAEVAMSELMLLSGGRFVTAARRWTEET